MQGGIIVFEPTKTPTGWVERRVFIPIDSVLSVTEQEENARILLAPGITVLTSESFDQVLDLLQQVTREPF